MDAGYIPMEATVMKLLNIVFPEGYTPGSFQG